MSPGHIEIATGPLGYRIRHLGHFLRDILLGRASEGSLGITVPTGITPGRPPAPGRGRGARAGPRGTTEGRGPRPGILPSDQPSTPLDVGASWNWPGRAASFLRRRELREFPEPRAGMVRVTVGGSLQVAGFRPLG